MGFWSRLPWNRKNATLELFREVYGSSPVRSGVTVTWKTALEVTAVLRCVAVISDGLSTVPLKLFQKTGSGRTEATDHPLHDVLTTAPNDWQDSLQFRETLAFHVALCGNAFVFVNRVRGRISELLPLEPGRVEVKRESNWQLRYWVTGLDGHREEVPAEAIWHLRGPSWNGYMGLEPVRLTREAIGLSMALEQSHARLHRNGVKPSGVYSIEGTLDKPQHERLQEIIAQHMAGVDNTGKPLILDRAAKWLSIAMTGVDAQHLETRKHQIEEICRGFGVNPIMVGYSDKTATYASAEQMFIAHAVHTIRPWHRRFEASIRRFLLTTEERRAGFYPKFLDNELMRGAAKDRAEYYAKALGSGGTKGWMTQNEVRDCEEMERSSDPEADKLPQPTAKPAPVAAPTPTP
ncbi:HK97 family phage portal protein [Azospirillum sp. OGB3]|uniref:phage portal protein n=1 Tax=Azospirillum sp. OGB3 TaxID=2587012 RepID=UPI0016065AA8|nr:phage portal protein [Azospirillum sp. OGB3]MBB3264048.1 HK97 family phage portal protein [Azospirillum sp. OGB3]